MRLFHFSESPDIEVFEPRQGVVWAVDEARQHVYWFPRECSRVTFWPPVVHVITWDWLDALRTVDLYRYEFDPAGFEPRDSFWVSSSTVAPLAVEAMGDLLALRRQAGIELRVVADLEPLAAEVIKPGAVGDFSIVRRH